MIFEKLAKEEQEAEKLLFGSAEEEQVVDEVVEQEVIPEPITVEVKQQEETPPQEDWKKRFTNFKATADNTIFQLRKDNAALKSDLASLTEKNEVILSELVDIKKQISKQKKEDSFNNIFTQEDEDLLGSDAINIFKKAVKKVAPQSEESEDLKGLKEEIRQLKQEKIKQLKKEQETVEEESFNHLKVKLSTLVDDWQEIDVDPGFINYLEEIDEVDSVPRKQLFSSAVQSRSAKALAGFYLDYKAQRSPKKDDILSKKVTPVGTKGTAVDMDKDTKRTYTIEEYNKFMNDLTRGKYRGKEKEANLIEAKFDKAFQEGRIVG